MIAGGSPVAARIYTTKKQRGRTQIESGAGDKNMKVMTGGAKVMTGCGCVGYAGRDLTSRLKDKKTNFDISNS